MAMFVPPDARQADWMIRNDADRSYLDFLGYLYELLCLYAAHHGLPHQIKVQESRDNFEDRMARQVENFELQARRLDGEYTSIVNDITVNKRMALALHQRLKGTDVLDLDADEFLTGALDAYGFIAQAAKRQARP
jgi:hypothetical protein